MPGRDPGVQLGRWADWFTTAETPAERATGAWRAVAAVLPLLERRHGPGAADALRTRAAEALEAVFDTAATTLEAGNTGRPGAAPTPSTRSAPQ